MISFKKKPQIAPPPVKVVARWFGARDRVLTGGVYDPNQPDKLFTVEFLEQTGDGLRVVARTLASRSNRSNDIIPRGHGFEFDVPEEWLSGSAHHPLFRVVETGQVFPRKPISFVYAAPAGCGQGLVESLRGMVKFFHERQGAPVLLLVTHETSLTGAPVVALNVLKYIRKMKPWKVVVLSLANHSTALDDQFSELTEHFAVVDGWNLGTRALVAEYLHRELRPVLSTGPVISLVSSLCSHWIGDVLGKCGIPSVWLIHEFRGSFADRELSQVGESAQTLVFPCQLIKGGFVNQAHPSDGVRRLCESALVRPQGIWWREEGLSGPSTESDQLRRAFREEHGIPADAFVVLGCGTVEARKGVDWFTMLAGYARAVPQYSSVHFIWVGRIKDDEFGLRLSEDLARCQMQGGNLHFPGQLQSLKSVYAASDVFLMCSRNDPYPNVFIDALAHGLPVVGFDQGQGSSELIEQFPLGTLVPYQDMVATMEAIARYLQQPDLRQAHGREGMRVVEARFANEDYGAAILALLEAMAPKLKGGEKFASEVESPVG